MKKKIFAKKYLIIKIFTKKKFVEKNFRTKNFSKKNPKKILNNFGNFFILKKENTVEIWLIFEKKQSIKSQFNYQSKDRKLSVKMSVNLGYFRLKHRLHNLPGQCKENPNF